MRKILVIAVLVMALFMNPVFNAKSVDSQARQQIYAPTADIEVARVLEDGSVKVRYNLYDDSNVLMHTDKLKPEVRLYEGDDLVKRKDATVGEDQSVRFANIDDETDYRVVIRGPYDMLGYGEPTNAKPYELASIDVSVPAIKAVPKAIIHTTEADDPTVLHEDGMEVHYDIVDEDLALINEGTVGPRIIVQDVKDDSIVYFGIPTVGLNQVEYVTELEACGTYRVSITGQYDVNQDNKADNDEPYILDSEEFNTCDIDTEIKPEAEWYQVYGTAFDDFFESVVETSDGGYVAVGKSNGQGSIVKFDSEGNRIWDEVYSDGSVEFESVVETSDGSYVAAGISDQYGMKTKEALLVKFDGDGNFLRSRKYRYGHIQRFKSVIETNDGGYVAAGYKSESSGGQYNPWLVKCDSEGNPLWEKTYSGVSTGFLNSVIETKDGSIVAAGYTGRAGLIVKLDIEGNLIWSQEYNSTYGNQFESVIETSDGGYLAAGKIFSAFSSAATDGFIVKFDGDGNPVWDQAHGGNSSDTFYSVIETSDGGYLAAGTSASEEIRDINNGAYDGLLVKFDSEGNPVWDDLYGGDENDSFKSIIETDDGGYVIAGHTKSQLSGDITDANNGSFDGLLVKLK